MQKGSTVNEYNWANNNASSLLHTIQGGTYILVATDNLFELFRKIRHTNNSTECIHVNISEDIQEYHNREALQKSLEISVSIDLLAEVFSNQLYVFK